MSENGNVLKRCFHCNSSSSEGCMWKYILTLYNIKKIKVSEAGHDAPADAISNIVSK